MLSSELRRLTHFLGQRQLRWILVIPPILLISLFLFAFACLADEKPKLPDLPDGWTRIEPGGDTRCAHDTPFAFWVRPGTSNNLLVYYRGGGSCWDAKSCRFGSEFYYDTVSTSSIPDFPLFGIFDLENPENPFKDY